MIRCVIFSFPFSACVCVCLSRSLSLSICLARMNEFVVVLFLFFRGFVFVVVVAAAAFRSAYIIRWCLKKKKKQNKIEAKNKILSKCYIVVRCVCVKLLSFLSLLLVAAAAAMAVFCSLARARTFVSRFCDVFIDFVVILWFWTVKNTQRIIFIQSSPHLNRMHDFPKLDDDVRKNCFESLFHLKFNTKSISMTH